MELAYQIVVAVFVVFFVSLLYAAPVMWLWDWLMPKLFQLSTITLWQAWGLSLLCGLLFKSSHTSESK